MIIDSLRQEHRNIEKLLLVLERELSVFDRGERPDYQVIHAFIAYFLVYPHSYHHPQEDMIFEKLRTRMAFGFSSSLCCTASSTCSCSHLGMRRSVPVVH